MSYTLAELPFTVSCPSCKADPGDRCATRLRRGYHLSRADKAVRADNRTRYREKSSPLKYRARAVFAYGGGA